MDNETKYDNTKHWKVNYQDLSTKEINVAWLHDYMAACLMYRWVIYPNTPLKHDLCEENQNRALVTKTKGHPLQKKTLFVQIN